MLQICKVHVEDIMRYIEVCVEVMGKNCNGAATTAPVGANNV